MISLHFLSFDEIILLHDDAITDFGGSHGLRDKGLLESALMQPQLIVFGRSVHKNIFEMAAAYCFHIIKNHPFVDGNKRTGILTAIAFLKANEIHLAIDFDSLYEMAIQVADSRLDKKGITKFLRKHAQKMH